MYDHTNVRYTCTNTQTQTGMTSIQDNASDAHWTKKK